MTTQATQPTQPPQTTQPMREVPLTWLYVPGDRPETMAKALAADADVVLVDLEDAVAPDRKEYARAATADLLAEPPPVPVHVRVNALDGPEFAADLAALHALAPLGTLAGLRLPKVSSPPRSCVRRTARRTSPCTPSWNRPSASNTPTPSPPPIPPCAASRSARPTYGPTWAYAPTRASTGRAPEWSWPPARRASPHRPSPSTPMYATSTASPRPAPTAVPWASSAARPSTPGSSR